MKPRKYELTLSNGKVFKLKALSYFHALSKLEHDHRVDETEVIQITRSN